MQSYVRIRRFIIKIFYDIAAYPGQVAGGRAAFQGSFVALGRRPGLWASWASASSPASEVGARRALRARSSVASSMAVCAQGFAAAVVASATFSTWLQAYSAQAGIGAGFGGQASSGQFSAVRGGGSLSHSEKNSERRCAMRRTHQRTGQGAIFFRSCLFRLHRRQANHQGLRIVWIRSRSYPHPRCCRFALGCRGLGDSRIAPVRCRCHHRHGCGLVHHIKGRVTRRSAAGMPQPVSAYCETAVSPLLLAAQCDGCLPQCPLQAYGR